MGIFFNRKQDKNELEGLDRAQAILDERYQKKLITPEAYQKQCLAFRLKREKYEKRLGTKKYDI